MGWVRWVERVGGWGGCVCACVCACVSVCACVYVCVHPPPAPSGRLEMSPGRSGLWTSIQTHPPVLCTCMCVCARARARVRNGRGAKVYVVHPEASTVGQICVCVRARAREGVGVCVRDRPGGSEGRTGTGGGWQARLSTGPPFCPSLPLAFGGGRTQLSLGTDCRGPECVLVVMCVCGSVSAIVCACVRVVCVCICGCACVYGYKSMCLCLCSCSCVRAWARVECVAYLSCGHLDLK